MTRAKGMKVRLLTAAAALACMAAGRAADADSPYAVELISQNATYGSQPLYNDPNSILGEPTSIAVNAAIPPVGNTPFHVKIVEAAYNVDPDGNKVITTLSRRLEGSEYVYGSITVKFDHPVFDDAANPYGIDLNIFGNAAYVGGGTGGGYLGDTTDMRTHYLAGGILVEPAIISVSPDNVNWYTYSSGPFGDTAFPTQGYTWSAEQHDATGNGWTDQKMDFTKPVNPTLSTILGTTNSSSPYFHLPTIDGIGAYVGSGGGTGIDLAPSGFQWIRYVRVQSDATHLNGDIDAVSDVRPMQVGEALSITADNITADTSLYFQSASDPTRTAVRADFLSVSNPAKLATAALTEAELPTMLTEGQFSAAYELNVTRLIGTGAMTYETDFGLLPELSYTGDGGDLRVFSWDGAAWQSTPFSFDAGSGMVLLEGWTQAASLIAISRVLGLPGDTDGDGDVDFDDLANVKTHFGGGAEGDADGDGDTDIDDLVAVKNNFGSGTGSLPATIPEPASAVMLAAAGMMRRRR